MKRYGKNYELKNRAKDKLEGRYVGAIQITLLSYVVSLLARLAIRSVAESTMRSVYAMTSSADAAGSLSLLFELLQIAAGILLGIMNAGIALYFLSIACGEQASPKDLFYGFQNDSRKFLTVSAALSLCQTLCLEPGQYLTQTLLDSRDARWVLPALIAIAVGTCAYVPISLGISMSFYLALDFPQHSGWETLRLCWRLMRGNRMRLFLLELSFLPLMLLCALSFGIGFLWLMPYMEMCHTCFFLDLMKPEEA